MNIFSIIFFAQKQYIYVLPVIAILVGIVWYRMMKLRAVQRILSGKHTAVLIKHASSYKMIAKALLQTIALIACGIALLRPQWGASERTITQQGRDIFIALDISRSMLAQDCKPDRLACAKDKIKNMLHKLSAERVGLILFSGAAFVQCPLTTDYNAFFMFLDSVTTEVISSGSTSISSAINCALEAYEGSKERKTKLLVLFTDGEDFSTDLKSYKEAARDAGLVMFTIGVGTEQGAPIPLYDEQGTIIGHQKDENGSIVITRLSATTLSELAQVSGGTYISMTSNDDDIYKLMKHVQTFEKEQLDDVQIEHQEDRYSYFLCVAFIALLCDWLL